MLGLAQAIYGPRTRSLVVIVEGAGEPEEDERFACDWIRAPEQSQIVFRSSRDTLQRSSAGPYSLKSCLDVARTCDV